MSTAQERPDVERVLSPLKDFQRRTVDYVFEQLYIAQESTGRFLIADEVGLGKTLVARGVIAKAADYLWDNNDRFNVVYICANSDIARQNINRIDYTGHRHIISSTRLTLLPMQIRDLRSSRVNFVALTPGTSFDLRRSTGQYQERALIYHILRAAWGFGNKAAPMNLFQCSCDRDNWRGHLRHFDRSCINQELSDAFVRALEGLPELRARFDDLCCRFARYRPHDRIPSCDKRLRAEVIGELRRLLATSCIESLEPDIVILDEFQRFKYLLYGEDDIAELARMLFDYDDVRLLLLSATPYKMYTHYDDPEDDDHYKDFLDTVDFLLGSESAMASLKDALGCYRMSLYRLQDDDGRHLLEAKQRVEEVLRRVIVRTERVESTVERDSMIVDVPADPASLDPGDLLDYITLDRVATVVGAPLSVEYWKSAPYLLSVMDRDGYKIKHQFAAHVEGEQCSRELLALVQDGEGFLRHEWVQKYNEIKPRNPKLRLFLGDVLASEAWRMLWVPPSFPYYSCEGSFFPSAADTFTKSLVFSAWVMVPRALAMMCSYEVERRMMADRARNIEYTRQRERLRPLLNFAYSSNRPSGMSNFALMYPCLTLATQIDPLAVALDLATDKPPPLKAVIQSARRRIVELIRPILNDYATGEGREDERWYWASLALLDAIHVRKPVHDWLGCTHGHMAWNRMIERRGTEDAETRFAEHVQVLRGQFCERQILGRPPKDLVDVLTKIALASPAVAVLRALLRRQGADKETPLEALAGAARAALGFRTLFNIPEVINMIRVKDESDDSRYWETVLEYCLEGNLQAVMDEYVHILHEALGLVDAQLASACEEICTEITDVLSLRTASLMFDEVNLDASGQRIELARHNIRCRFALPFADTSSEDDQRTRRDQVRRAFNSPFWPFVVATTSIGQEGLDFHQYCHSIYHWNLPPNPVDLEQREGRVHRYKGHVIRRNVAMRIPFAQLRSERLPHSDPWQTLFHLAGADRLSGQSEMIPYWIYEVINGEKIRRHVPALPFSREEGQLARLKRLMAAYRLVFGQPRQEDLLDYLSRLCDTNIDESELGKYHIDLRPKA